MATCILKQARALEDKDIDRYMSYVHPQAPNREDLEGKVRSGMKLGPTYVVRAKPTARDGKSMVMEVEMNFDRRSDGSGRRSDGKIVTNQVTLRVEFRDHGGTLMIWRKTVPCPNPACKKGKVPSVKRQLVGTDPASGRQLYFDSPGNAKCAVCRGTCRVAWQDVP
jgi:hypothetical protein